MKAKILRSFYLPDIPSASGVEIIDKEFYVIGDDSLYLFHIDIHGNIKERIPLVENVSQHRIAKQDKADFEAITSIYINKQAYLLVIGSGSLEAKRDFAKLINLNTRKEDTIILTDFYSRLKSKIPVEDQIVFNIEGLCSSQTHLYFAQRGNITGHQIIFKLEIKSFFSLCENPSSNINIETCTFQLPETNGVNFGISGCCFDEHTQSIIFCAAAENIQNTYDDGQILGSIIGIIDLNQDCKNLSIQHSQVISNKKIESLCILKTDPYSSYTLLAVCDNDTEASELLEIKLVISDQ